jgi:hypothetical protein
MFPVCGLRRARRHDTTRRLAATSIELMFRNRISLIRRSCRVWLAIVEGSPDRNRLLPLIYLQEWTGADDRRHEIGGTLATLKRILFSPWPATKGLATRPWLAGRYWVAGRGHRRDGRFLPARSRSSIRSRRSFVRSAAPCGLRSRIPC